MTDQSNRMTQGPQSTKGKTSDTGKTISTDQHSKDQQREAESKALQPGIAPASVKTTHKP